MSTRSPSRRQRRRIATEQEIKDAALAQIAEHGAPGLSLRAVARTIDMSPAGLYRYYDGRDALLTALLVDAYTDLADTVEAAMGDAADPTVGGSWDELALRDRLTAGIEAYRGWALSHPNRFLLIFGTPVPGYAAPEGGATVAANTRMGQSFLTVAARLHAVGGLRSLPQAADPTPVEHRLADQLRPLSPDIAPRQIRRLLGTWARWHGLVILEVTHQWDWAYDDPSVLFSTEVRAMLDELGSTA